METILLASSSQRRKELLEGLGIPFETVEPGTDESLRDRLPPAERVVALAEDKARAGADKVSGSVPRLVIGADTLVCRRDDSRSELVMGKPADREEARGMIEALQGRDHFVHTGLALLDRRTGDMRTVRSDSLVRFAPMSGPEIEAYLDTGEWEGVAGAYRVQGAAALYIMRIDGSWSGIVGLPLRELYVILREAGYRVSVDRQA